MPNYAIVSSAPSLNYEDVITGYAVEYVGYSDLIGGLYTVLPCVICYTSSVIIFGINHPLFVSIHDAIQIEKEKPKLYYHFWSAVFLSFGWLMYQLLAYFMNFLSNHEPYYVLYAFLLFNGLLGTIIPMASSSKEGSALLFLAPLSLIICCNNEAKQVYTWIMTAFGFFITLALVTYIIYAIPSIVFVYYLYPTRTAVRLPFIMGAIFYTISLMSLVLYQIEKFLYALLETRLWCNATRCSCWPINHHHHRQWGRETQNMKQQCKRDKEHYMKKIWEDLKTFQRSDRSRFLNYYVPIMYVMQAIASLSVLIIYLYSVYLLAKFVFKQTKKVDGIDALLTLVPTFLSFGLTWIGRSYIFDVKKDIQEAMKKKAEQNSGDTQTSNEGVTEKEKQNNKATQTANESEDQYVVETRQLQVQEEVREPVPPEIETAVTIEDEASENGQRGTLRAEKEQRVIDYANQERIPLLQ